MRWPWTAREDRDDTPNVDGSPRPMGWAFSPPLTGVMSAPPTVLQATRFATTLPAWSSPRFLGELSHLSSDDAPSALVGELVPGSPRETAPAVDLSLHARALSATTQPMMRAIGDVQRTEPTLVRGASSGEPARAVPVQRIPVQRHVDAAVPQEAVVPQLAGVAEPDPIAEAVGASRAPADADHATADYQRPLLGAERPSGLDAAPVSAPVQRSAGEMPRRLGLGAPIPSVSPISSMSPISSTSPVSSMSPVSPGSPISPITEKPGAPPESLWSPEPTRAHEGGITASDAGETAPEPQPAAEVVSAPAETLEQPERPAEMVLALQRSVDATDTDLPTRELLGAHPLTLPAAAHARPGAQAVVGAQVLAPAPPPLPPSLQRETTPPSASRRVSVSRIPFTPSLPTLPSMPSIPSMPTVPSMPNLPTLPSPAALPSMPPAPSIPGMPSLGSLPSAGGMSRVPGMPSLPLAPNASGLVDAARASAGTAASSLGGQAEGVVSSAEAAAGSAGSSAAEAVDAARAAGGSALHGAHDAASAAVGAATSEAGGAAAALGGAAASLSPEALDKLVAKIAPPLLRRLKSELIQDRERRGLRTDARAGGGA